MNAEGIAKIFADWEEQKSFEWEYTVDSTTYREQKAGFFKQSLPGISKPIKYTSTGEEIFLISDLHLGAGRDKAGVYYGTENFFADEAFFRFIDHIQLTKKTITGLLIINGDLFDFLRVTAYPGKVRKISTSRKISSFIKGYKPIKPIKPTAMAIANEFANWSAELEKIGIKRSPHELEKSISKKEQEYGLETDDYKAIYKLIKIKEGHPLFFIALAKWLVNGNRLLILKGNHDLEIYWDKVRNYFRVMLAESIIHTHSDKEIEETLKYMVLPKIKFVDDSVLINEDFYIEHGHRYDKFTMVLDSPTLKNFPTQINIPLGSFFNRYFINRAEMYYPYLDKVRPMGNIIPMLLRDNFPLALKIIFEQIPLVLRILSTNLRYVWFTINKVFWLILALIIPVIIAIVFYWASIEAYLFGSAKSSNNTSVFLQFVTTIAKSTAILVMSYFLARLVGWFQLTEPDSLEAFAKNRAQDNNFRIMTMGHTHNPGEYLFFDDQVRFYNSGTWIPVIEMSNAEVREDGSYTFLHLERDENDRLQPAAGGLLQRWNDDAGRPDPQLLIKRK